MFIKIQLKALDIEVMKEKIKKIFKHYLLRYFLLAFVVYLITECFCRRSVFGGFVYLFTHPVIFLLNVIIVFWSYSLVLLTRRKKFMTALVSILWLAIGVVDFILRCYRVTPFNASDFTLIKSALSVALVYMSWWQLGLIIAGIVLLIAAVIVMFVKLPESENKPKYLIALLIVVVNFFAVNGLASVAVDINMLPSKFGNLTEAYADYGIAYCFSNSLLHMGISKPDTYSEEVVSDIVENDILPQETLSSDLVNTTQANETESESSSEAADDNEKASVKADSKTPNIIFLQLESFFDVERLTDVSFSEDPIPYFHRLQDECISGYLSVPSVGAGTANTEFEIMTGMNLDFFGAGEYPYNTVLKTTVCESIAFDLKDVGYTASAIHNNDGSFYGRNEVFSQLGYDKFIPIEYMDGYELTPLGWAKDSILPDEIIKTLNASEGADYIYTISVQGHGAYPTEDMLGDEKKITVSGIEEEADRNAMEYYVNQINQMDSVIGNLIDLMTIYDEETVIVMYGDHLPSLGITDERLSDSNTFQTEYIIWSNFGLEGEGKNLEAYQLSAYLLDLLDIHVGTMVCYHQNYFSEYGEIEADDEELQVYLDDMEILEYDILYGEQTVYEDREPYEASDLKFGNYDIVIDDIWTAEDSVYVLGGEFNEYSKIFINDKPAETEFISKNVIYAPELELDEETYEIKVMQVCEDRTVLGGSETFYYGRD